MTDKQMLATLLAMQEQNKRAAERIFALQIIVQQLVAVAMQLVGDPTISVRKFHAGALKSISNDGLTAADGAQITLNSGARINVSAWLTQVENGLRAARG